MDTEPAPRNRSGLRTAPDRPPVWVRLFVYVFLTVFAATAVLSIEWWPFSSWRLFSQSRAETMWSWEVVSLPGPGRREQAVDFAALPRSYHGWLHVVSRFPRLSVASREDVCETWAEAMRARGTEVDELRIYRLRWEAPQDFDQGTQPPPVRKLLYTCARAEG